LIIVKFNADKKRFGLNLLRGRDRSADDRLPL
jgi:hypothetical protein